MKELILFGLTIFVTVFIFANRAPSSSDEKNALRANQEASAQTQVQRKKRENENDDDQLV